MIAIDAPRYFHPRKSDLLWFSHVWQGVKSLNTHTAESHLVPRRVESLTNPRPLGQLVHTLSVSSSFSIEHGVLVLGQHLTLLWHLMLPSFESLCRLTLLAERRLDDVDYAVDFPEPLSLSEFARYGELPGDFPGCILSTDCLVRQSIDQRF